MRLDHKAETTLADCAGLFRRGLWAAVAVRDGCVGTCQRFFVGPHAVPGLAALGAGCLIRTNDSTWDDLLTRAGRTARCQRCEARSGKAASYLRHQTWLAGLLTGGLAAA